MSRTNIFAALAAATILPVALSASGASAESYTTRIETRPFYGATVTLEEGVRVIRPLPPERHVIINPDGLTPLTLGFNETNVTERRNVYNYNMDEGGAEPSRVYGYGGGWGGWNGRGLRNHGGHHRNFAPGLGVGGGGVGGAAGGVGGGHGHGSHR